MSLHLNKTSFPKNKNKSKKQMPRLHERLPVKKKLKALTSLGPNADTLSSGK